MHSRKSQRQDSPLELFLMQHFSEKRNECSFMLNNFSSFQALLITHFKPPSLTYVSKPAFFIFPIFAASNNAASQMWARMWHRQQPWEWDLLSPSFLILLSHTVLCFCLIFPSLFSLSVALWQNLAGKKSVCEEFKLFAKLRLFEERILRVVLAFFYEKLEQNKGKKV